MWLLFFICVCRWHIEQILFLAKELLFRRAAEWRLSVVSKALDFMVIDNIIKVDQQEIWTKKRTAASIKFMLSGLLTWCYVNQLLQINHQ